MEYIVGSKEIDNLKRAETKFLDACWTRLVQKFVSEGYTGWDNRDKLAEFTKRICQMAYPFTQQDCVDMANYCMFIWNLREKKPLKTSAEWEKECNFRVVDPDGWDRANFKESWNEKITEEEFTKRLIRSTLIGKDSVQRGVNRGK